MIGNEMYRYQVYHLYNQIILKLSVWSSGTWVLSNKISILNVVSVLYITLESVLYSHIICLSLCIIILQIDLTYNVHLYLRPSTVIQSKIKVCLDILWNYTKLHTDPKKIVHDSSYCTLVKFNTIVYTFKVQNSTLTDKYHSDAECSVYIIPQTSF